MENEAQKTKYEKLGIPQQIILQNGTYSFKKELINSYVTYRCVHRACKANIKISIDNAKKLFDKNQSISSIEFTLNGEHEQHPAKTTIIENTENIKTEKENINLAKQLINKNIDLPL